MSVSTGTSFILSAMLSIVLFCGMQMYRHWLASSPFQTVFGGYLSSVLFVLILTFLVHIFGIEEFFISELKIILLATVRVHSNAIGNLETAVFGKAFQTKLFPEVFICIVIAISAASMIHRVCVTICILFSIVSLYYMNKLSQVVNASPVVVQNIQGKKRKGN